MKRVIDEEVARDKLRNAHDHGFRGNGLGVAVLHEGDVDALAVAADAEDRGTRNETLFRGLGEAGEEPAGDHAEAALEGAALAGGPLVDGGQAYQRGRLVRPRAPVGGAEVVPILPDVRIVAGE
jgi:hypothetical protein